MALKPRSGYTYSMTAFNSKWKYEKLAARLIVRVRGHFAVDGYEMYKGLLNTLVLVLLQFEIGSEWSNC